MLFAEGISTISVQPAEIPGQVHPSREEIFQPDFANPLVEVANNLKGVTPLNTFTFLTPEEWSYSK